VNILELAEKEWRDLHAWQRAMRRCRSWAFRRWDRDGQTFFEDLWWLLEEKIERLR